jgi:hypothetical protein
LERRLMLDLTIDTATVPQLGLRPRAFVAPVDSDFLAGGSVEIPVLGGVAIYQAHPERRDYRELPSWQPMPDGEPATLAEIFRNLPGPPA